MNLGRLSINQPILAMVLSIVLLIVGAIAYTTLPVSEYPQVVPPTVVVTTHRALEKNVQGALGIINRLPTVKEPTRLLRIFE